MRIRGAMSQQIYESESGESRKILCDRSQQELNCMSLKSSLKGIKSLVSQVP